MGTWFETYRSKNVPFERGECQTSTLSDLYYDANGFIIVENMQNEYFNSGYKEYIDHRSGSTGWAKKLRPYANDGGLLIAFSEYAPWSHYDVLDTDYTNYAFLYSCESFFWGLMTWEYAWVLQRDPDSELNERILGHAKTVFKREIPGLNFD